MESDRLEFYESHPCQQVPDPESPRVFEESVPDHVLGLGLDLLESNDAEVRHVDVGV